MSVERVNSSQIPSKLPGGLPNWGKISSYIKQVVKAAAVKHRETEPFVVQETMLYTKEDKEKYKRSHLITDWVPTGATLVTPDLIGSVQGYFLNNKTKEIKGEYVKPLDPNVSKYPVRWEHVTVVEYNGQHYYKDVINYKNSPNENSAPFKSEWQPLTPMNFKPLTPMNFKPFGETFEQQDIRRVKVCEGEIVYEGRFGNSIKLGCNHQNNKAIIKLRAGQQKLDKGTKVLPRERVNESIDNDAASIYLVEDGLGGEKFGGESIPVSGSILMNSDNILINAREDININTGGNVNISGEEIFLTPRKGQTLKIGDPMAFFIPTINADVMNDLMKEMMTTIKDGFGAISKATTLPTILEAIKDVSVIVTQRVPKIVDIVSKEKYLNKMIMVQDPNRRVPKRASGLGGERSDGRLDGRSLEGYTGTNSKPSKRTDSGERDVGPRRY